MYSVVLMAAMTAAPETPAWGDFWAKHCFWEDCWPARYGWTCGPGWGGYYPATSYSCHGCWGGGCYGASSSCHGCWSSCHGCWGGCGGGWGPSYGCMGACHGCWSSCYGYTCYGGYGGGPSPFQGIGYSGFGAYGNFGMYGAFPVANPNYSAPLSVAPDIQNLNVNQIEIKPTDKRFLQMPAPSSASIAISVPANAKVYIDNNLMKSTSTERIFMSPLLEPGESYFYTVRVVIEKDGKEAEDVRKVIVRAGQRTELAFDRNLDRRRPDDRKLVETEMKYIK
jgi:uncharacterized protein (TIGR03000 family)